MNVRQQCNYINENFILHMIIMSIGLSFSFQKSLKSILRI